MISLLLGVALALERSSQLAMGTVVGITVAEPVPAATIAATWAELERWEALLSEWRPDSLTSRLNRGETVTFPPETAGLWAVARSLEERSRGRFSLLWQGGQWVQSGETTFRLSGGEIGLGGILKGWLVDQAAAVLIAAGVENFLVDAAGDIVARGALTPDEAGPAGEGWPIEVEHPDGGVLAQVVLRDAALSTSGDYQQPGHIVDARTGKATACTRGVSVVAPTGVIADGLATTLFARCSVHGLPRQFGAVAVRMDATGGLSWSQGARRVFRQIRPEYDDRRR